MMSLRTRNPKARFQSARPLGRLLKHYARGLGATRRVWAKPTKIWWYASFSDVIRATDFIQDPRIRQVLQLLLAETKNNKSRAEAMYRKR